MGCCVSQPILGGHFASHEQLAKETHFSIDEVYALEELFKGLSNKLHKDGLIHKDEFALGLFKLHGKESLFVDQVFKAFDTKQNDVIDFEEFVRALSVFHPRAPLNEKADFAFKIYDLKDTGVIEKDEVKRLLIQLLQDNPAIDLTDDEVDTIVEQTFEEADLAGDGIISLDEWRTLVCHSPDVIGYMTLPVLKDVTVMYPSFIFNPRRRYERSRRGERSFSTRGDPSRGGAPMERSHLAPGTHSFDVIPPQRSIRAT
ncbi:g9375 [Coccomyxa elongata]